VATLVSLYLLTDYCCYGSFNKDLFLDDLVACRTTFCSSLLVNAICAAGMVSDMVWHLTGLVRTTLTELACLPGECQTCGVVVPR
jgi:hypothetical protein